MGTPPMSVHVRARFDGKVFVPEEPLDLPPGTVLEGDARRPLTPEEARSADESAGSWAGPDSVEPENSRNELKPEKPLANQEEWTAFLDRAAGTWIGTEMDDPDDPIPEKPDF